MGANGLLLRSRDTLICWDNEELLSDLDLKEGAPASMKCAILGHVGTRTSVAELQQAGSPPLGGDTHIWRNRQVKCNRHGEGFSWLTGKKRR
jgi:hypothetical protein